MSNLIFHGRALRWLLVVAAAICCTFPVAAVAQTGNAAQFVNYNASTWEHPGTTSQRTVFVTMRNIGTTTWTAGANYRLGSQWPENNLRWGIARVPLPKDVPPGDEVTFAFNTQVPATPGVYVFRWQMLQEGVEWFGDATPPLHITAGPLPPPPSRQGNAAQFLGVGVATTMTEGEGYDVVVGMRNIGSTTWTNAQNFRLGSQFPENNRRWRAPRVSLPHDVPPGHTVQFRFRVTAPERGIYPFAWRMVQDGVEWFGEHTAVVYVTSAPLPHAAPQAGMVAQFVSFNVPTIMVPGGTYPVSVTMRNVGSTTWTAGANIRLGSAEPYNNRRWGFARVNLPHSVAPGQEVTFDFNVVAPNTGVHPMKWRMLQEGVAWFGEYTTTVYATVGSLPTEPTGVGNVALYEWQIVPVSVMAGQEFRVLIGLRNNGTTTWTEGDLYRLGSVGPRNNRRWGISRVQMPHPVPPGHEVTVSFWITAPTTRGIHNFSWQMVQDQVEWFGPETPNIPIVVR